MTKTSLQGAEDNMQTTNNHSNEQMLYDKIVHIDFERQAECSILTKDQVHEGVTIQDGDIALARIPRRKTYLPDGQQTNQLHLPQGLQEIKEPCQATKIWARSHVAVLSRAAMYPERAPVSSCLQSASN